MTNLSMKLGRTQKWDPATHTVFDEDQATKLLQRPYRQPWVHPDPKSV